MDIPKLNTSEGLHEEQLTGDAEAHLVLSTDLNQMDPYKAPPKYLKDAFKKFHFLKTFESPNLDIVDFRHEPDGDKLPGDRYDQVFNNFLRLPSSPGVKETVEKCNIIDIPGLTIFPNLLSSVVQRTLLDRLLHRDLSNPKHKTNLHLHYDISYPENGKSFFTSSPPDILLEPKDPKVHKKLEMKQVFDKKLRWMTLGGQYDWTKKVYPAEMPPDFPKDIADLVHGICPWMEPQAAITNVYSPGDTLSLHRDVSEEVNAGLVSISLGCDCLFMIGVEDNSSEQGCRYNTIRLHSGDVLFMEGPARFAWHGVPKIIPDSCPFDLSDWPNDSTSSGPGPFPQWQGWMKNKRINLNVRQMREN